MTRTASGVRLIRAVVGAATLAPGVIVASAPTAHADDGVIAEWQGNTLLGRAQNGWHWWGPCRVIDFNGGAWGWYLRASNGGSSPTYRIHHGMLGGYTAFGGPSGIGCPTSNEYGWNGGVRQDFTRGYLYWRDGMSRAVPAINGTPGRFAIDRIGQAVTNLTSNGRWSGWCLRFAYLAHGRSWSTTDRAIWEWQAAQRSGRANVNTAIPVGAIVYYSWAAYGHAGVHVGDGWVVSTDGTMGQSMAVRIHRFNGIGLTYLGWAWPLN